MIAECKRIRTRKGDPMMFATLDDLEGQVEMLVFNSAYAAHSEQVDVDKTVLVRGRETLRRLGPRPEGVLRATEEAVAEPLVKRLTLHVSPGVPESFLEELREVVGHHQGEDELLLAVGEG